MINSQKENGFVPIATEIMKAFPRIRIPGEARQLLDLILRLTYGFNQKAADISLNKFVSGTGLNKPAIIRGLNKLQRMNLISVIQKDNGDTRKYSFIKQYELWKPLSKKIMPVISVIQKDNGIKIAFNVFRPNPRYANLLETWNKLGFNQLSIINSLVFRALEVLFEEGFTDKDICTWINNYKLIINDGNYIYSYKWTLLKFLEKGNDYFRDLASAKDNFRADKSFQGKSIETGLEKEKAEARIRAKESKQLRADAETAQIENERQIEIYNRYEALSAQEQELINQQAIKALETRYKKDKVMLRFKIIELLEKGYC